MSIFFDYKKLTSAPVNESTSVSYLAWHTKLNLLAAALCSSSTLSPTPSSLSTSPSLTSTPSSLAASPSSTSPIIPTPSSTSPPSSAVGVTTTVWVASASTTTTTGSEEGAGVGGGDGDEVVAKRSFPVTCMIWDTSSKVLIIGWSDGMLSLWSPHEKKEDAQAHKSRINFIVWDHSETGRFATGDQDGVVAIWKLSKRNGFTLLYSHSPPRPFPATHCIFLRKSPNAAQQLPWVAFGGGRLLHALWTDDKGNPPPPSAPHQGLVTIDLTHQAQGPLAGIQQSTAGDELLIATALPNSILMTFRCAGPLSLERTTLRIVSPSPAPSLTSSPSSSHPSQLPAAILEDLVLCWAEDELILVDPAGSSLCVWGVNQSSSGPTTTLTTKRKHRIVSVAYSRNMRSLAAGTGAGSVLVWRYQGQWEPAVELDLFESQIPVVHLAWGERGASGGLLACATALANVPPAVVIEHKLHHSMAARTSIFQVAPDRIILETFKGPAPTSLQTKIHIRGLCLSSLNSITSSSSTPGSPNGNNGFLAVSTGNKVEVYQIKEGLQVQHVGSFSTQGAHIPIIGVHPENIFFCQGNKVEVCSHKGTTKQSLGFSESEGDPFLLDVNGDYMAVATRLNVVRLFDLSRREIRTHGASRKFESKDGFNAPGVISSLRTNSQGSLVSILITANGLPSSRIVIYVVDRDMVFFYDFDSLGQYPVQHFWDSTEPRLLCCQNNTYHSTSTSSTLTTFSPSTSATTPNGTDRPATASPATTDAPAHSPIPSVNARKAYSSVNVLFATGDQAPVLLDHFPLPTYADECIGIEAPYIFFRSRRTPELATGALLKAKVMRDFVGMENIDDTTKTAMLDFGYHMALGNMDEAYKAVSKLVKNTGVWSHLARMSVQTRRLDVLGVCLGNMGHARAARALREAIASDPSQPLVHLAAVAVHLGMHEDAINLLVSAGRSDLLNAYYQACGNWENAIQIANTQDRINLRTTHYNHAKHLEILGDLTGAIPQYESANAHRTEVPRMLLSANSLGDLEAYIDAARDKSLYMWRAKLCESKAQWDLAFKYYDLANDYLSLIRIRCFQNNFDEAKRIAIETKDKAASYHLAHQFENEGNIKEALQFYSRAECFNHGIRLAIEHELDADLMNLALQSGAPRLMVQAAHHFEEKGNMDKAVMLYQKGGALRHAVQLCISARLYDQLESVVNDLDQPSGADGTGEEDQQQPSKRDPELLAQCANFFIDHHQFERAAHLLVLAGDGQQALELCLAHNIPISEDMADQIAPPLRPEETPEQSTAKIMLLRLVAKCCKRQGAYHLATKKYTQAKDKLKAMKVLLKSGDTEKIIFFAGVSRQQEIYIMAANYLQTLNWRSEPEIMKQIVTFYTKAKAPASLALFYEACSQVEIDEYQNYDKALGALREAQRHMVKARTNERDPRLVALTARIQNIERFLQARKLVLSSASPAEEAASIFHQLLDTPDINFSVRIGDIIAQLVSYHYMQGTRTALNEAYALIDRMIKSKLDVLFYLDEPLVRDIYAKLGLPFDFTPSAPDSVHGIEEDIREDN